MKKLFILALGAVMAVSVAAQDKRHDHARGEKATKEIRAEEQRDGRFEKGWKDGKKHMTREERVEFDIKHFTKELYLSDKQAENFAKTYREYRAKADELFPQKCCKDEFKEGEKGDKKEARKELSDKELDRLAKERFAKKREFIKLQETYYDKFRKDLNPRQVEKVLKHKK